MILNEDQQEKSRSYAYLSGKVCVKFVFTPGLVRSTTEVKIRTLSEMGTSLCEA